RPPTNLPAGVRKSMPAETPAGGRLIGRRSHYGVDSAEWLSALDSPGAPSGRANRGRFALTNWVSAGGVRGRLGMSEVSRPGLGCRGSGELPASARPRGADS